MGGIDKPNLVQTSLEVNRVKQLQKAEFRNVQGHIETKQKETLDRDKTRLAKAQKAEDARVDKDKKDKREQQKKKKDRKGQKGEKERGGILDLKA